VVIESQPGQGTVVTLLMPRTHSAEPPEAVALMTERPAGGSEAVLVVDDEDQVRSYSVDALRELGYRVLHASDAGSALNALDANPDIRLLFTDIGLPGGVNGRQLAVEARRRRPDLKVLLTSGYAAEVLLGGGRLEPGMQLLPKPFSHGDLRAKIRGVLDAPHRPSRILVVEDDPMVRMTIVEALADAGCWIEEAATASEALIKFDADYAELDAAIVDIGLPDGRGDGLVDAFHAVRPDLAIVLATGYGDAPAKESFQHGAHVAILDKPFEGTALRAALLSLGVLLGS